MDQTKSLIGLIKSKVILKEISDNFTIKEIAILERTNTYLRNSLRQTFLNIYSNIYIQASDFTEFDRLIQYLQWYQNRMIVTRPQTLYLDVNNYYLKEDIADSRKHEFLSSLATVFKRLYENYQSLRSIKIYMFKQQGDSVNDGISQMVLPLLKRVVDNLSSHQLLDELVIDSYATDEMIEQVSKLESLKELRLTDCKYITGGFLNNLKSNQLATLDFQSSYQIQFDEVLKCVQNNKSTIKRLSIDGEYVTSKQLIELIDEIEYFEEFRVFFGELIRDDFLFELGKKMKSAKLQELVIRKAIEAKNTAFNIMFSRQLNSLTFLNLDECQLIEDDTLIEIGSNCPNLKYFSLSWCPLIHDAGISSIIKGCKKLREAELIGLKNLTDGAFIPYAKDNKSNDCQPQDIIPCALDSLISLNLTMCDYVNDSLLEKIKRQHTKMKIINYYQEEIFI